MNLSAWIDSHWLGERTFSRRPKALHDKHTQQRTQQHRTQVLLVSVLTFTFLVSSLKPVFAEMAQPHPPLTTESAKVNPAPAVEPQTAAARLAMPPLPFTAPEVGPLIKNQYPNDINRRTTAFIPQSLDNLTPIQFPKTTGKWIRVDLSEQIAVAYEGQKPIRAFHISSGLPGTPTVTGEFHIRMKVLSQTMTGGETILADLSSQEPARLGDVRP